MQTTIYHLNVNVNVNDNREKNEYLIQKTKKKTTNAKMNGIQVSNGCKATTEEEKKLFP